MKRFKINDDNKAYFVRRYCDFTTSHMDNLDLLSSFKEYFFREKMSYPIDTLETEINKYCPDILEDHLAQEIIGKGAEYAKAI